MTGGGPMEAARRPALRRLMASVRGRLLILICVATLPVIGITVAQAWHDYEQDLAAGPLAARSLQERVAAQHRVELDLLEEMLLSLSGLLEVSPEACGATLRAVQALSARRLAGLWMLDREGRLRCSTLPAEQTRGAADGPPPPAGSARLALGGFLEAAGSSDVLLAAALPIGAADGGARAEIGATIRLAPPVPPDPAAPSDIPHQAWLIDRAGVSVALTAATPADLPRGELPSRDTSPFVGAARSGEARAWSLATVRPGLRVMVGVPMDGVRSAARAALASRLIAIAGFVTACLGVILLGAEISVARPLRRLAVRVRAWSPGEPYAAVAVSQDPWEVKDLDAALLTASRAIAEREAALRAALAQRDLAIEEMNHRVHNNLQIVASLLGMQSENSRQPAVKAELALTRHRVRALATLYRHLSRGAKPGLISLRPFIAELCEQLGEHAGVPRSGQVRMTVDVEDIELEADEADSLTLLVTEAVTNAVQHAFPDGMSGTILVSLRRDGANAHLVVSDDGIGLPEEAERGDALGLNLIGGFASHLGGAAEITSEAGTRVSVTFPLRRA